MSLPQTPEVYQPAKLWQPHTLSGELTEAAAQFLQNSGTDPVHHDLEDRLANDLAHEAEKYISAKTADNSVCAADIYRAATAIRYGKGNCIAYAEATAAVGKQLGLNMSIVWQNTAPHKHAFNVWHNEGTLWIIDGDEKYRSPVSRSTEPEDGGEVFSSFSSAYEAFASTNGRLIVNKEDGARDEWRSLPPVLSDTTNPYEDFLVILPADEGIQMLAAMGDTIRYQRNQLERWEQIKDQVTPFIPPGLVTVQAVV